MPVCWIAMPTLSFTHLSEGVSIKLNTYASVIMILEGHGASLNSAGMG